MKKAFQGKAIAIMINKYTCGILAIVTMIASAACNPTTRGAVAPPSGELVQASNGVLQSGKQRETSLEVNQANLTSLVEGNDVFAFDLYQKLKETNANVFYSPYSISEALAMTYAGARGNTEKQMADTLHFDLPQDLLHPTFNSLDQELTRRAAGTTSEDEKSFQLHAANAIWGQRNYKFLASFLDVMALNYGAGLRIVDFEGAPEQSRLTINEWVRDQTEDKINDLIPPGAIDGLTRLVLTNAIYFNSDWQSPFDEKETYTGIFHLLDGGTISVPMMRQTAFFNYAEDKSYKAVELPYKGNRMSMVILLPEGGKFNEFEQSLDAQKMNNIIKDIEGRNQKNDPPKVALIMPKLKYQSDFNLGNTLSAMGMPDAFGSNADFSGMTGTRELFIGVAIHKAFVSVDEQGTEAAAATALGMVGSAPGAPIHFTIDRPFIFLIRDIQTGAIIFIGRVLDPRT